MNHIRHRVEKEKETETASCIYHMLKNKLSSLCFSVFSVVRILLITELYRHIVEVEKPLYLYGVKKLSYLNQKVTKITNQLTLNKLTLQHQIIQL